MHPASLPLRLPLPGLAWLALAAGLLLTFLPGIVPLPAGASGGLLLGGVRLAGLLLIAASLIQRHSPLRWFAQSLGRGVEALAGFIPARITAASDRWLRDEIVEAWLERRFRHAADPLLAGHPQDFALREWPAESWPTLYMDIPPDIRRPILWDGRTLVGRPAEWLAWRHFTLPVAGAAVRAGVRAGLAWGLAVALFLLVVTGCRAVQGDAGPHPYPSWAAEAGVSGPVFWWYVERVAAIVAAIAQGLFLTAVAAIATGIAAWYFATAKILQDWWEEAARPLRTPTLDSLVIHDARADTRPNDYLAYVRQAKAAAGRLAGQPLLPIGRATGALRARGDMESPAAGQVVALDGESIREHVLAVGAAGSGKTRLVMLPLFEKVMTADWGAGHHLGAIVLDGKGTLWRELLPAVEGRNDLQLVGTGPGQKGVDLLAGMTPFEIAATLTASAPAPPADPAAGQAGEMAGNEPLSLLISHVATLCAALDTEIRTVEACRARGFRPWSLVGIHHFAGSAESQADAIDLLHALRETAPDDLAAATRQALASHELWNSIRWLEADWRQMAHDARAAIIAALAQILGPLVEAGALRERFAAGLHHDLADLSQGLEGGVLMVAIGETEWGIAGGTINRWIKSRLFALARKRLDANRERFRDRSIALFVDDFQMLATPGSDGDSSFWTIARETGIFLVAATRSLATLRQVLGEEATRSFLGSIRTTLMLPTSEAETLDHLATIAGDLPKAMHGPDAAFETQAMRERAIPDIAPPVPTGEDAIRWGCVPQVPAFGEDEPAAGPGLLGRLKGALGRDAAPDAQVAAATIVWRPKLAVDDLPPGGGLAFAIVRRAGADRTDIVDLTEAGR